MSSLDQWVASSPDARQRDFRSVVHIILHAIASHHDLQPQMIMKGGILMAIAYRTGRFTKDIDFSTPKHYREFAAGQDAFIGQLDQAIKLSASQMPYGFACAIQSHELKPGAEGNFQTLHLNVGYAPRANTRSMAKLEAKQAVNVVKIDYSFNELVGDIGLIDAGMDTGEEGLQTYGQLTLIAEKLRALIQQGKGPGGRPRISSRGQDVFDLHALLSQSAPVWEQQEHLLRLLIDKAASRGVEVTSASMADPTVYERSLERYRMLAQEIEGDLPDFDAAFKVVRQFYEGLPWPKA